MGKNVRFPSYLYKLLPPFIPSKPTENNFTKKSVTPATLNDYQAFMVTGRRFPATFLPPQANLVPTFSTYWNFLYHLVELFVPASGRIGSS